MQEGDGGDSQEGGEGSQEGVGEMGFSQKEEGSENPDIQKKSKRKHFFIIFIEQYLWVFS